MIGLAPYPYKPSQGKTEDLYNKAFENQKKRINDALVQAMKFDRIGKKGWSKPYYTGVSYIHFLMNYANIISQKIDFIASTGVDPDIEAIRNAYCIPGIIKNLPCISHCKGVNVRAAFLQILKDFGIAILATDGVIPPCPGIGLMIIGSTLDDAFTVGGTLCVDGVFSAYDDLAYDNDAYTINVTSL